MQNLIFAKLIIFAKKKHKLDHSLYTLLQIFNLPLFKKTPVNELFTNDNCKHNYPVDNKQLCLFDL